MTIRDRKALKQTAGRRLGAASYRPHRLVLIHSGIALGIALLVAILNYIIQWQIDAKGGGLSGLPLRSVLDTAATVLSVLYAILSPFWSMGMVYAALRLARGKAAYPRTLLEGFRRFGPVLRLMLMRALIYGILCLGAMYISGFLFSMTPAAGKVMEVLESVMLSGEITDYNQLMEAIPEQTIQQMAQVVMPIFCVVALILLLPAAYRLRMADYVLMDKSGTGAWKAIRTSNRIMKRQCVKLLVLDLSYWWYYLIQIVLMLPVYADLLLGAPGITLPVEEEVLYLLGYLAYAVLTLIFEVAVKPKIMTTYALAYDALQEEAAQAQPQPVKPVQYTDVYGYPPQKEE